MNAKVLMPCLSEDGWVNGSMMTADYLLSHFFIAEYSQTQAFIGEVSSLPYLVQKHNDDSAELANEVAFTLKRYFSRYFNNVVAEARDIPNEKDPSAGQISVFLSFQDTAGETFTLSKMIQMTDSKVTKIIDISNGT